MKLCLYSQIVKNGEDSEALFNGGVAGSKLFDVKLESVLRLNPGYKKNICMLAFNDFGCLVYVIKPLFSRMGDYRALILVIPRQVQAAALGDIAAITQEMSAVLTAGEDPRRMEHWFRKDYREQDFMMGNVAAGRRYACRFFGKGCEANDISDLLGMGMLQKEYMGYEGVFFLDRADSAVVRGEAVDDLTRYPFRKPVILTVPPRVQGLYLEGRIVDRPLLCHVDDTVRLTLRKDGCEDYDYDFRVSAVDGRIHVPDKVGWQYKVYYDIFRVVDEQEREITSGETRIDIAERMGDGPGYVTVPLDKAAALHVTVARKGCVTQERVENITKYSKNQPLKIKMEKKRSLIKYKIGKNIAFELDRTEEEAAKSPLPLYNIHKKRADTIVLKKENIKKKLLTRVSAGVLAGLLVGALAGWFLGESHGETVVNDKIAKEKERVEQLAKQQADSLCHIQIVGYLDSIPRLNKQDLDSLFDGRMSGLYDALNIYDFTTVQAMGEELMLGDSRQWARLDSVINMMNEKRAYREKLLEMTKNEDEQKRKFFSPDGTITFDNYIKKLNEARGAVDQVLP